MPNNDEIQESLDELVRRGVAVRREDGSYALAAGVTVVEDDGDDDEDE
jgi:hypothetical protein